MQNFPSDGGGAPGGRRTRESSRDIWGERTPYQGEWPERVDEHLKEEPEKWVQSACVLCSNGCAVDIGVKDNRIVGVRGRAVDRVNRGRLGPKGLNGWQANHSLERLTRPLVRRSGKLVEATWDEAMSLVVSKAKENIAQHTPHSLGFYNTGQLFIEEYYALGMLANGGIGTPHVDGNTRLCTATASQALMQSFGTDGAPGSYTDFDVTEAIMHIGHNPAYTQTVQWMRILDRLAGPNRPRMVVIDPRRTATAQQADVHLAPKPATNLALLNGLLHLVIKGGRIDRAFIERSTLGYEELEQTVAKYTPEFVEAITGVPTRDLEAAADIVGGFDSLVSTVLQGVYQSNQATAAAVQVNNLHLIRGLIGKPGCTVFQMNGQPSAQNARECGTDGEFIAFRNFANPKHVEEIAKLWNVNPEHLPGGTPPTHAMEIFHLCEMGSIRFLWVICTNPAVSMPELHRIRKILAQDSLFVVVSDAFLTETAALADVVLPAAIWAEKTGTFTNADRTVHLSEQAITPPGEARSDFEIFLDFAQRMDLRDQDGAPLIKFSDPASAFDDFKRITAGRPCDYSGLSHDRLRGGSGMQWPVNETYPNGRERLYEDGVFNTDPDYCEIYGNDLETGAEISEEEYRAREPRGRALIKPAEYHPPLEEPDERYPLWLTTGRVVHHFHTRTKTGRTPELQAASPEGFVQVSADDAARYDLREGDLVEVESRRGKLRAPARIGDIEPGVVFVPFHYGYWDEPDGPEYDAKRPTAANELTLTTWDPVSKQPHFKYAAVRLRKLAEAAREQASDRLESSEPAASVVAPAGEA